MKTLIGIVTFGNLPFTKLCIRGIRETTTRPYEIFVIVGKPDDAETREWLSGQQISFMRHSQNMGFPASINDLYDLAWSTRGGRLTGGEFDNLIILGNDVIPLPGGIDAMIDLADREDSAVDGGWEWICGSQFDSKSLIARYPEARQYFAGDNLQFTDFEARPWELHEPARLAELAGGADIIEGDCIKDVRNFCLFKRSVFEKIGYADVNFFPGGYFEDNDYCTRGRLARVRACGLPRAAYFHFWSRTIHQGEGRGANDFYFGRNSDFYQAKWGGPFGGEKWERPFNGEVVMNDRGFDEGFGSAPELRIANRLWEPEIINYWRSLRP